MGKGRLCKVGWGGLTLPAGRVTVSSFCHSHARGSRGFPQEEVLNEAVSCWRYVARWLFVLGR